MKKIICLFFAFALCLPIVFTTFNSKIFAYESVSAIDINALIESYYINIDENIANNRTAGTSGEKAYGEVLSAYLQNEAYSYYNDLTSYTQSFTLTDNSTSQNIVGVKDNEKSKYVIIGAHYDNVYIANKSYGYSDNLSGIVGAMSLAKQISNQDFNVILVFFGAEEVGMLGSTFFAKTLPEEIRNNVLLFINYDSIGGGDNLYYFHTDYKTNYGNTIDSFAKKNWEIEKLNYQKFSTLSNNGLNYSNLGLNSDNSSFIKRAVNSISFFAGNLDAGGLGFFETKNHKTIMHNTDTKETIDEVFGDAFVNNICTVVNSTSQLLQSESFNETNFAPNQIKTFLYSDWTLKICGVIVIIVLFVAFMVYEFIKYPKIKSLNNKKK